MNTLNRVLIVILLLVAIPLCTIMIIFPEQLITTTVGWLSSLATYVESIEWYVRGLVGIMAALIIDVGLILLLYFELRHPKGKPIRVKKATGGNVTLGVSSISERLIYELDQLPGVLRVRPKISTRGDGVVVDLEVNIATGVDVPDKANRIVEVVQEVVEEKLGLKLTEPPRVNLHTVARPQEEVEEAPSQSANEAPTVPSEQLSDDSGDVADQRTPPWNE